MSDLNQQPDVQTVALESVLKELGLPGAAASVDHRVAEAKAGEWAPEQFLARLLGDELSRRSSDPMPRRVTIADDARWFQVDDQPAVSLVRRTALRRLLLAVMERRGQGTAASVGDMIQAGWPREALNPHQGATRVYTAIRTLRRMGLERILLTTDRGYELAPEVDVIRQPS